MLESVDYGFTKTIARIECLAHIDLDYAERLIFLVNTEGSCHAPGLHAFT